MGGGRPSDTTIVADDISQETGMYKQLKRKKTKVLNWHCLDCNLVWRQPLGIWDTNKPLPCDNCHGANTFEMDWYDVALAARIGYPGAEVVLEEICHA